MDVANFFLQLNEFILYYDWLERIYRRPFLQAIQHLHFMRGFADRAQRRDGLRLAPAQAAQDARAGT